MDETRKFRHLPSLVSSILLFAASVYGMFMQSAFPMIIFLIATGCMLYGAILMQKSEKEQAGAVVFMVALIFIFAIFGDMIWSILSLDNMIRIGSGPKDKLTFSVVERLILVLVLVIAAPSAVVDGLNTLLNKKDVASLLIGIKLPIITYLFSSALTVFAIGWACFYLLITRGAIDFTIFLPIFIGLLILFFLGWWSLHKQDHFGFIIGYFAICAFFYAFLAIINYFYIVFALLNVFSILSIMETTKEKRKEQREKYRQDRKYVVKHMATIAIVLIVSGAIIAMPSPFESMPVTVKVENHSKDIIEINWAYGSEMSKDWDWLAWPEILNMMTTINSKQNEWGINISVTIPLVREIFNQTYAPVVANIMIQLYNAGIVMDLMPIVDSSVLGYRDEYIHDDNIEEFKKVYKEMKAWLAAYNISHTYRSLVIDLERTTSIDANELLLNWWSGQNNHMLGQKRLLDFMDELRRNGEKVSGAFFGFHLFDTVDLDDAQQDFFKISIVPPNNWEYIAAMIYQSGRGSNHSVYAYCQDMNYHFGDRSVPYAVTMRSSYDDVLTRLRIMKYAGFDKIGMWAMHELFANGTLFGMSGHKNATPSKDQNGKEIPDPWTPDMFIKLHEDLSKDVELTYTFNGFNDEYSYELLILVLDLWLNRRPVYTHGWPIMSDTRVPNKFTERWIITILAFAGMAVAIGIIPWRLSKTKSRSKEE